MRNGGCGMRHRHGPGHGPLRMAAAGRHGPGGPLWGGLGWAGPLWGEPAWAGPPWAGSGWAAWADEAVPEQRRAAEKAHLQAVASWLQERLDRVRRRLAELDEEDGRGKSHEGT
ncbi:hypothetical protein caldi_31180 [Caldinitratiruptor microaerophilus]|uniref:Uncharacterized protein n=1 Tax=Caldinitratiruptor microaerophilus TaxID=671077 RepID=A0AA35GA08_9FIRM|nr:hypothetical protein caldi_31180 [Caldinitratiruptor microaerophilus]